MTESMILPTKYRGIGKGIGFMIGPGHQEVMSKELLQEEEKNDRCFWRF